MSDLTSERYDIAFAGECLDGFALADVKAGVAKLFKADEGTLNRLFSGNSQRIKRNCDKSTALKYQKAMNAVGARVTISLVPGASPPPTPTTPAASGGEDLNKADASTTPATNALELAPAGTDVLRPDERQTLQSAAINTSHLTVADTGSRLSDPDPAPTPVVAPDFDIAEVGATLDVTARNAAPASAYLDSSSLTLAPAEHDLSDCAAPAAEEPKLSLDHLSVEDAGTDLLRSDERRQDNVESPDTSHLSVEHD